MFFKMLLQCAVTATVFILAISDAAYLPTYIGKCSLRDSNLNLCIKNRANKAIPKLVHGDLYYDIPYMSPLLLLEPVILKNDRELQFILNNAFVYGLKNAHISDVNFTGNYASVVLTNPSITVLANYEINGQLLNTPIYGRGQANFTLEKGTYRYETSLAQKQIDNELYFKFVNPKATYETGRSYYYLDNLYSGDVYLGAQMNRYLNQNWKAVQRVLRPAVNIVISNIYTTVNLGIANNVPIHEIFNP